MRIVAGQFRGRPLKAPKGEATRPTTDRVRESMMSAVESARGGLEGAVVLDAFAGSGALGLEALSRGARCAHFFERSGEALRALCANVRALGLDARRARLHRADVLKDPPVWASEPFDLVFLDPPYRMEAAYGDALTRLRAAGRLAPGALAILERAEARAISLPEGFSLRDARCYGETCVEFVVEGEEA